MKPKKKRRYSKRKNSKLLHRLLFFVLVVIVGFFGIGLFMNSHLVSFVSPEGITASHKDRFISKMSVPAMELHNEYGVLPSITIAQGILESDWGKSDLAKEQNNYYGIKGDKNSAHYVTREYNGEWIETSAPFESYDSLKGSMEAHATLLANGPEWDSNHYQEVIQAPNYKKAAKELQNAGYATDPNYADKLISIVERHDLNRFDS